MISRPWRPSAHYARVVEANRQYYASAASLYETSEFCVSDPTMQRKLQSDLDTILALRGLPTSQVRALDACGGAGNVALKLAERGARVTLVDVSSDLLDLFRAQCASHRATAQAVESEIGTWLASTAGEFDLITFSSALHHLEDPASVLELALGRLAPGGMLFTIFDPVLSAGHRRLTRWALRFDYVAFKFLYQTRDVPAAALRVAHRVGRRASREEKTKLELNPSTAGVLAEYHVERGLDDEALTALARRLGFDVVWHRREAGARFRWTAQLIELSGDATTFKLLIRRPV